MTKQTAPIDLYFWMTPNGQKISILLEELGVPYTTHLVNISKGEQFEPEFLKVSPNNRIPAIVDPEGPDGAPISIFESGAILKYLAQKFDKFYPTKTRAQVKVDEWLSWQIGGLGPMVGQLAHFARFAKEKVPYAIERYHTETKRLYGVLDRQLEGQDYIAGDISIADIATIGWIRGYKMQQIDIADYPNVGKWVERMLARDGVKKGFAVGQD